MEDSFVLSLRPWLLPHEAAVYLSDRLKTRIKGPEILRFGLDGAMQLSVHLPAPVEARICETGKRTSRVTLAEGIWTLPMEGQGKLEIESLYALNTGGPPLNVDGHWGAEVTKGDVRCQLPGTKEIGIRRGSAIPQTAQVVVTMEDLRAFELSWLQRHTSALRDASSAAPKPVEDAETPLKTRERQALYAIIAALAHLAKIDLSTPSKSADAIEAETARLGCRVSVRTISNHLNAAAAVVDAPSRKRP